MNNSADSAGIKKTGEMGAVASVSGGPTGSNEKNPYSGERMEGKIDQKPIACNGPRYAERDGH